MPWIHVAPPRTAAIAIAVASQFHSPEAIEPYSSELVGATRGIVLGKKSGLDSIRLKAEMLGVAMDESQRPAVLLAVKRAAIQFGRLITDEEFVAIVRDIEDANPLS